MYIEAASLKISIRGKERGKGREGFSQRGKSFHGASRSHYLPGQARRHYYAYFMYFNERVVAHDVTAACGSLQPHGFISREGIKDLQFYFPQLCETRCLISFFLSFFFAYACALKSYRAIFPLFLSLSLPPSLSLFLSGGSVSMHGMQLGSLRDPSLSISFPLRASLYAPIGTRLAVIWTSKEIRKRYRNEKFYTAVCPKHRADGISGSFCVRPDAFSSHSLQRQISPFPTLRHSCSLSIFSSFLSFSFEYERNC